MKIFITGATGLLGRAVYRELKKNKYGYEVTGSAFSRAGGEIKKLNLLDNSAVEALIDNLRPDIIIHSAAERRPDVVKADTERAEKLNIAAVETIARAASAAGSTVIYMSTDYVFDGTSPPYSPEDKPDPLNHYGKMKLAGEQKILGGCDRSLVLRVPILYGEVENLAESAVTIIAESISADAESFHDNTAIRYPTHTEDVAGVIGGLTELLAEGKDIGGIYHWSSGSPYTKYGMALVMAGIMGVDPQLIREAEPDPDAAPRPMDAHLDTERLRKMGLGSEKDFSESISRIIRPFISGQV
jgi:dTDP-4-dehydrorhamnose reductase